MFVTNYKGYRVTVNLGQFYGFLDHSTPCLSASTLRGLKCLITRNLNKGA